MFFIFISAETIKRVEKENVKIGFGSSRCLPQDPHFPLYFFPSGTLTIFHRKSQLLQSAAGELESAGLEYYYGLLALPLFIVVGY